MTLHLYRPALSRSRKVETLQGAQGTLILQATSLIVTYTATSTAQLQQPIRMSAALVLQAHLCQPHCREVDFSTEHDVPEQPITL